MLDETVLLVTNPKTKVPAQATFVAADVNPDNDGDLLVFEGYDPMPIRNFVGKQFVVVSLPK